MSSSGGSGSSGSSSGSGGSSGSSSGNCLLYGTFVTLADGRRVPIESLAPGDMVQSLSIPGLRTDVSFKAQYEWMSTWGLAGTTLREARIAEVRLGEHDGFFVVNGRVKATFEHPFLVRRDDTWGFCSAELLQVGDQLITFVAGQLDEEPIVSLERIDARVRTVRLYVPGTNTYLADGAWTHNDSSTGGSLSAVSSSSSSSSKSGGSSFSGSGPGSVDSGFSGGAGG